MALKPTIKAVFPPVVLGNTENTVIITATKEKIIWRKSGMEYDVDRIVIQRLIETLDAALSYQMDLRGRD